MLLNVTDKSLINVDVNLRMAFSETGGNKSGTNLIGDLMATGHIRDFVAISQRRIYKHSATGLQLTWHIPTKFVINTDV